MKLRKIFGALLVLGALEGCDIKGSCKQDANCPEQQFCHIEVQQCFSSRYSELKLLTLAESNVVGGAPVLVQARLELESGARPVYPPQLNLTVTPATGGTPAVLTLQSTAEGTYGAEWTPPPGEGTYTLQVAHPESWGPSRSVQVTVDRTAPVLLIQVPEAQPTASKNGFTYADPAQNSAWRRDQLVVVRVESDSADLDPTSLRVVVRGHNGGTNVTDLALTPVTPCNGKAYCGAVNVSLWRPGLEAFRGNFQVEVTAKDRAGNERTERGNIPVTRWKWSFNGASGPVLSSPAIGEKGTVYFGTSDTNGKVFALNPDGTLKWQNQLGSVTNSPAVGSFTNGAERVYVGATAGGSGVLFGLDANGLMIGRCLGAESPTLQEPITTAVAISNTQTDTETAPIETAFAYSSNSGIVELRPDAPTRRCIGLSGGIPNQPGASMLAKGGDAYFGGADETRLASNVVETYGIDPTRIGRKPGFESPRTFTPITGMGFVDDNRIAGATGSTSTSEGRLFFFNETDGRNVDYFPKLSDVPFPAPVRNLAIGAGKVVFFGYEVEAGSAELTALDLTTLTTRSAPNVGSLPGAPVLGSGGTLYTASASGPSASLGEVSAWSVDTLTMRWKLSDSVGRAQASPSLDCSRNADGIPAAAPHGVLYVPALNGQLYAFIVDSPGLDKNAPWPKYQHDARNTGNPATPITNCP